MGFKTKISSDSMSSSTYLAFYITPVVWSVSSFGGLLQRCTAARPCPIPCQSSPRGTAAAAFPASHMSHNQNPVLKWLTQNHAGKYKGGCSYFWLVPYPASSRVLIVALMTRTTKCLAHLGQSHRLNLWDPDCWRVFGPSCPIFSLKP